MQSGGKILKKLGSYFFPIRAFLHRSTRHANNQPTMALRFCNKSPSNFSFVRFTNHENYTVSKGNARKSSLTLTLLSEEHMAPIIAHKYLATLMQASNTGVINEFYGAANFHIVGNKEKGVIGGLM